MGWYEGGRTDRQTLWLQRTLGKSPDRWVLACRDRAGDRQGADTGCAETLRSPEHTSGPGKYCGASAQERRRVTPGRWVSRAGVAGPVHVVREQAGDGYLQFKSH